METIGDRIDENMKDHPEYKNLSFDRRGEFCVKLGELIKEFFGEENN